jgi:hypothetical protein
VSTGPPCNVTHGRGFESHTTIGKIGQLCNFGSDTLDGPATPYAGLLGSVLFYQIPAVQFVGLVLVPVPIAVFKFMP